MLKKLRIKFVCVNMLLVTVMLTVILALVFRSTARSLESASVQMLRAQAADTEYYTALSKAERQSRTPAGGSSEADTYNSLPGETKVSVTSGGGGSVEIEPDATSKLYFYGTERLLSYAIDKPEPAPDPGTGGGG